MSSSLPRTGDEIEVTFRAKVVSTAPGISEVRGTSGHRYDLWHESIADGNVQVRITRPELRPGMVLKTPGGTRWFCRTTGNDNEVSDVSPQSYMGTTLPVAAFFAQYPEVTVVHDPEAS